MGHAFDFIEARDFDRWLDEPRNRRASETENRLMIDLLRPIPGETILDIGCGTGRTMAALRQYGLQTTGLDPSPYMLDIAHARLGRQAALYRGVAEDLPFEDNSFNHACLDTTLEFVETPAKALEESFRVAKDRVYIGFLNRSPLGCMGRMLGARPRPAVYAHARHQSLWGLKRMVRRLLHDVPLTWRTVCRFEGRETGLAGRLGRTEILKRCPIGSYGGMVVVLVPRFRTRPLSITYRPKARRELLAG
jgi:SAM-dependent methyltransferase